MGRWLKTRILFVDDEPAVLRVLGALVRQMRPEWEVFTADSGRDALALAERETFDVVVSDMRMPEMNGAQVLQEFRNRHAGTIRIILSGYADHELIIEAAGTVHQWLAKPCNSSNLCNTIERAVELERRLSNDQLKQLVVQIGSLPSLPRWYYQLLEELNDPRSSTEEIGELIARDMGMSVKLLQMVNSAYFGMGQKVAHPTEAVQILGMGTVRALALSIHVFSCYKKEQLHGLDLDALWERGLQAGVRARRVIGLERGDQAMADAAYTAGLLHETGRLILAANLPDLYLKAGHCASQQGIPLHEAELQCIGVTHADAGACMLGLWGLPDNIVEAVAWQHTPVKTADAVLAPLTAVHFVSALGTPRALKSPEAPPTGLDWDYLGKVGVAERVPEWMQACLNQEAAVE